MSDRQSRTSAPLRLDRIRALLRNRQQLSIPELAEMFKVSEMTIRRDLDTLESNGHVRRTHGGAMPAERMVFEFDFAARRRIRRREKQAIAHEAVKLIRPGHRIILDTGTTVLEVAHLLREEKDLTVITPSLAVASLLQFSPNIQTVLLGGIVRPGSPDLTGPLTEGTLEMFAADLAFQGADGIGDDGAIYGEDIRIVQVDKKMRRRAERTYVLADSSKVGKTSLVVNGFIHEVDGLITDEGRGHFARISQDLR
jgi:DeoR/GlpR family transcriptional regulator of sugar metabolism